jgi:hypothetical protein
MRRSPLKTALALSLILVMATILPVLGQSTTKQLSTNYTLINLGDGQADGTASYFKPDGSAWGNGSEDFTITDPGGQIILRQYYPAGEPGNPSLTDGNGSVVIESSQPLAAVVQIQARNQDPASYGAYAGFTGGDESFYVPLAARALGTASGLANSQIIVQNTGTSSANIAIDMVNPDGSIEHTDSETGLAAGASYYYDLALESSSNVPDAWYGSAVVRTTTTGASIAVVSNFFTGDAMQTFNGFSSTSPGTRFYVPLFASRLANTLSTVIAVQNLSGGTIAAHDVDIACKPDPALTGVSPFSMDNPGTITDSASHFFNPVTDMTIPAGFYGSCVIDSTANIVAFVQMRILATGQAAAYEAIPAGGSEQTAFIPLVAKRLGNGFATVATIQNKSASAATVDLTYTPSTEYSGSSTPVQINDVVIQPYASLLHNHRVTTGGSSVPQLPDGWYGSLTAVSDVPIDSFVQLTFATFINPSIASGDTFMAHNGFVQ